MRFRVLGPIEVLAGGTPVPLRGKPLALLARLLLSPNRVVPVAQLLDDLSPGEAPQRAEVALRTLVSRLRKRLDEAGVGGRVLRTRAPGYVLEVGPGDSDAARFEALLVEARTAVAAGDWARSGAVYEEALSLWRGPAYAEVAHQPFAMGEAGRLEELRLGALEDQAEAELALGRHAELVAQLETLTERHPLRERLWSLRMVALYRSGRQADALRAFQSLRERLVEDLGIEPGPDLQVLEKAILQHDPSLAWKSPAPVVTAPPPAPASAAAGNGDVFVGRDGELAEMHRWWTDARDSSVLGMVYGEPGIGKTRLVAELARRLEAGGALVLWGSCDEDAAVPYEPFAHALTRYVRAASTADLRNLSPWRRAELARVVPVLAERVECPQPAVNADAKAERYRLFEAVVGLLADAAASQPVLLVLDDLHWADRPTLLLLRHVVRETPANLLVVGLYRDTEVGRLRGLRDLLAQIRRERPVPQLWLGGLDAPSVVELVSGATDTSAEVAAKLGRDLHERTAGNPLFVTEVLRGIDAGGEGWAEALEGVDVALTDGAKEVISRRVARLGEVTNRMLTVAAVAGKEFALEVVARAAGLDPGDVVDAVEEATAAGVLVELETPDERYAFSHVLVREAIYESLLRSRRSRIHGRVGRAIEEVYGDAADTRLTELAHHFGQAASAGEPAKAAAYALAAANRAVEVLAVEEAEALYRSGLAVLDQFGPDEPALRCDLVLGLATAEAWAGSDASRDRFLHAATLAREASLPDRLARAALGVAGRAILERPGVLDETRVAVLEEAMAALPPGEQALRSQLCASLANALYWSDRPRTDALSAEALELAAASGDARARVTALVSRHGALWGKGNADERVETASELIRLAERITDVDAALQARRWRVMDLLELGDLEAVDRDIDEHARLADDLNDPLYRYFTALYRSMRAFMDARYEQGERYAEDALALGAQANVRSAVMFYAAQVFRPAWEQDRLGPIVDMATEVTDDIAELPVVRAALTFAAAERGWLDEARARFEELWGDLDAWPRDVVWPLCMTFLAQACADLGDASAAADLYRRLSDFDGRLIVIGPPAMACLGPAAHYLGLLAATIGEHERAAAHFEDALAMLGGPYAAHTELAYGELLLATGDGGGAAWHLDRAGVLVDQMGMTGLARRLDDARVRMGALSGR